MKKITFYQIINQTLFDLMKRNKKIVAFGLGIDDPKALFGTTKNLKKKFGDNRVFDFPTSENAMTGIGIGMSLNGMIPIMTHLRLDFFLLAMDQLVNNAAKWNIMFGGQNKIPITIRLIIGRGWGQGPTHSQNLQSWFAHIPGLKVVMPTFPSDAYNLLKKSIRDPNPVIFAESAGLYGTKGEVPEEYFDIEIGKADTKQEGTDITLISYGHGMPMINKVSEELLKKNVSSEIIDLRSLSPIDYDLINKSVQKTGRALLLDTARKNGGVMAEVATNINEDSGDYLDGPILRVGSEDVPWPYNRKLEQHAMSSVPKIMNKIEQGYSL